MALWRLRRSEPVQESRAALRAEELFEAGGAGGVEAAELGEERAGFGGARAADEAVGVEEEDLGIGVVEFEGSFQGRDGLVEAVLDGVDAAEGDPCLGVIGVEAGGFLDVGGGFAEVVGPGAADSEIELGLGEVGVEFDGSAE